MIRFFVLFGALWAVALIGAGCEDAAETAEATQANQAAVDTHILVFTKTDGWRHESIPSGVAAMWELAEEHDFSVTATEDASFFSEDRLNSYDAVVFLNTTETIFDDDQRAAFESYIQQGGGFVGVHSAADTEYDWPWYGELVGAYFDGHPPVQEGRIEIVDGEHPSTEHLADQWIHTDEWYSYRDVYEGINVLLNLDEESYDLGDTPAMGEQHPIAWYHEYDGGRAWYTGLGHTVDAYQDDDFRQHLLGGIKWAAGMQ